MLNLPEAIILQSQPALHGRMDTTRGFPYIRFYITNVKNEGKKNVYSTKSQKLNRLILCLHGLHPTWIPVLVQTPLLLI